MTLRDRVARAIKGAWLTEGLAEPAADAAIGEFFKFAEEFLQERTNGGWGLDAQSFLAALKREAGEER